MNRLAIALAASLIAATALPAVAQNASQISRVRGGASCPGCNLFQGDFSGMEVRGLNLASATLVDMFAVHDKDGHDLILGH